MNNKSDESEILDFRNGFGYMCHVDLNHNNKMLDSNGVPDSRLIEGPDPKPLQVSQGTQAGLPARRPRPLLHHSSEYLSRIPRGPRQPPPRAQPWEVPPYLARRRPFSTVVADSPASSLDCLMLKDNLSMETVFPGSKLNGEDRRLGTPSGASSRSCRCCCHCAGEPEPPSPQSAEGLSWRRLHMSRAKLKATATTSELLSGFAMIAMVELQINEPTNVPEWLFVMFAVCTTVLVAVHIFALMISTYLLPTIDAVSKMSAGDVLRESPHERMRGFIELAWAFSTVLGLFLFLIEIAILCWVKFWDYSFVAATAATVIVIPVLIVFVAFAVHFYHSLVVHKCDSSTEDMEKLESMKRNLDSATSFTNTHSPV